MPPNKFIEYMEYKHRFPTPPYDGWITSLTDTHQRNKAIITKKRKHQDTIIFQHTKELEHASVPIKAPNILTCKEALLLARNVEDHQRRLIIIKNSCKGLSVQNSFLPSLQQPTAVSLQRFVETFREKRRRIQHQHTLQGERTATYLCIQQFKESLYKLKIFRFIGVFFR